MFVTILYINIAVGLLTDLWTKMIYLFSIKLDFDNCNFSVYLDIYSMYNLSVTIYALI